MSWQYGFGLSNLWIIFIKQQYLMGTSIIYFTKDGKKSYELLKRVSILVTT
jgi:hypothetical protein